MLRQASFTSLPPHLQIQQTPPEPVSSPSPVQVISWYPSRTWRGPTHQQAQLGSPLYLQGQLWGPQHLSLGVWGWGSQPAHQLVVRQAGIRLRLIRCFATKHPLPAWTTLSQTPRLHWSDRQQQRQKQHHQQMQQQPAPHQPLDRSASDDTIDVLEACCSHPQQAQWRPIWELAGASYLDRVLWWRVLHGSLMCRAYRAVPAQANCPFSCCVNPSRPQTISHLFMTCPVAATVTDWLCRLWQAMTGYLPVVSLVGGRYTI